MITCPKLLLRFRLKVWNIIQPQRRQIIKKDGSPPCGPIPPARMPRRVFPSLRGHERRSRFRDDLDDDGRLWPLKPVNTGKGPEHERLAAQSPSSMDGNGNHRLYVLRMRDKQ